MDKPNITVQPIPQEVLAQSADLAAQSYSLIAPYLLTLTPEDRKNMLKMNNGTDPFVSQGIQYMGNNPDLVPTFVNTKEMVADYGNYNGLNPLYALLSQYCSQISDTRMAAGGTAYNGVLSFYNNIKLAAKNRVPGAKSIFEDLKKRFAKKKKTEEEKRILAEKRRIKEEKKKEKTKLNAKVGDAA